MSASLAVDPFTSLAVHYGMLLGVPDFQVISSNPRGKLRLHQAWQHGPGVVWGFGVSVPDNSTELQVEPGLAVDVVGREVVLATEYCLDVAQWLDGEMQAGRIPKDATTFNARLILRFHACLARPVPAMSSSCEAAGSDVAFSRVIETGELELRAYGNDAGGMPQPPPDDRSAAFADLRAFVREGTSGPGDPPGLSWLEGFRRVAARSVTALGPPAFTGGAPDSSRLFPADEPGEITLADLPGMSLAGLGAERHLVAPTIDLSIRRSHVPTWVLEELIAELLAGRAGPVVVKDAGGPRVSKVGLSGITVTVELTADILETTLAGAFELHQVDTAAVAPAPAWSTPPTPALTYVPAAAAPAATPATITFQLPAAPTATVGYRMTLRGTGPQPLVGLVGGRVVPLAGSVSGPPSGAADGRDVVEMFEGAQP
jgi:hypothetical protein